MVDLPKEVQEMATSDTAADPAKKRPDEATAADDSRPARRERGARSAGDFRGAGRGQGDRGRGGAGRDGPGRDGAGRDGAGRDGRRQQRRRRRLFGGGRVCHCCVDKIKYVDYKEIDRIRRYVTKLGKIQPRRLSGACARHQRMLTRAIKRARHIGLLPFTSGRD